MVGNVVAACRAIWTEGSSRKRCGFARLVGTLARLQGEGKLASSESLPEVWPVDPDGFCAFHSAHREWKASVDSVRLYRTFLSLWDTAIRKGYVRDKFVHLKGCVFTGQPVAELGDEGEYIDLSELKLGESLLIEECRFLDTVWFAHSKMVRTVSFEGCSFESDVDFGHCIFEQRFNFQKCSVKGDLSCHSAEFRVSADFESLSVHVVAFNEAVFAGHLNLASASAEKVYLVGCKFLRDINSAMANFSGLRAGELHIDHCEFYAEVRFDGMSLRDGDIIDTRFPPDKVVSFDGLRVSALLHIKSRSPEERMFSHAVSFRLREIEDVPGRIVFENANTFHLRTNEVAQALLKMRPPRLVFGAGCDPYRLKKEVRVPCSPECAPLIDEMANTFGIFFRMQHPRIAELKVECEFGEDSVLIRYFADADLEEDEFLLLIHGAAPQFGEFLLDPERVSREFLAKTALKEEPEGHRAIRVFDLFRKGVSLVLGFAARAQNDLRWDQATTRSVLGGTGPLHEAQSRAIHQHFCQISFFSRSTQIMAGRDLKRALPVESERIEE